MTTEGSPPPAPRARPVPAAPFALEPRVIVAIAVTVLAWASAFIVIRGSAPYFSGGALALGRLIVGTVVLGVVALAGRRWVAPNRREWLQIIGFGALWFGAYNVALNIAEHTLDAGTTAMIVNIGPILIALGAGAFLREGIPRWLAIGAGVAFVGVLLIGVGTGLARLGGHGSSAGSGTISSATGFGVLWCLVAAVTYSAGVLLQKPALKRLPNAQVTWLGCAIGMVVCLPFAGQLAHGLALAPPPAILGVLYLGAIPTALAFSTWAFALSRMPASQLGVTTYIVPALAIILGLIVFGEVPAPLAIVGGVVCLVGVALSRRRTRIPKPSKTVAE